MVPLRGLKRFWFGFRRNTWYEVDKGNVNALEENCKGFPVTIKCWDALKKIAVALGYQVAHGPVWRIVNIVSGHWSLQHSESYSLCGKDGPHMLGSTICLHCKSIWKCVTFIKSKKEGQGLLKRSKGVVVVGGRVVYEHWAAILTIFVHHRPSTVGRHSYTW